jgi:hypothetical protein
MRADRRASTMTNPIGPGIWASLFRRFAVGLVVASAAAALDAAVSRGHAETRHACAADAIAKAAPLLKLHFGIDPPQAMAIDDTVKVLPPIRALKGNGRFDVLEVWGHIYKADYRMRFVYAQIRGSCVLMGQEVLEAGNPY